LDGVVWICVFTVVYRMADLGESNERSFGLSKFTRVALSPTLTGFVLSVYLTGHSILDGNGTEACCIKVQHISLLCL